MNRLVIGLVSILVFVFGVIYERLCFFDTNKVIVLELLKFKPKIYLASIELLYFSSINIRTLLASINIKYE